MAELQQDPSMEEILASIKRVISEDGARAPVQPRQVPPRRPARPEPVANDEDVLELDQPADSAEPLVSPDAATASRQSLAALSAVRAAPTAAPDGNGALETAVRDMLRPMLKDWLDANLPGIVEAAVKKEVERIARSAG